MAGKDISKKIPTQSPKTTSKLPTLLTSGSAAKVEPETSAAAMADLRAILMDIKAGQDNLTVGQQKVEVALKNLETGQAEIHNDLQKLADQQKRLEKRVVKVESGVSEHEKRITTNEIEIKAINVQQDDILDKMAMIEMKVKEPWLRIRGLPESEGKEDLKAYVTNMFAALLKEEDIGAVAESMIAVYRLNSRYARENKLPRDIIVQFTAKQYRDLILSSHFESPITIQDRRLMLMKEIPLRILRKRKDFAFFTAVLKKNGIPFRWLYPQGLAFKYNDIKYNTTFTILTVSRARHFLLRYGAKLGYEEVGLEEDQEFQQQVQEEVSPSVPPKEKRKNRRSSN